MNPIKLEPQRYFAPVKHLFSFIRREDGRAFVLEGDELQFDLWARDGTDVELLGLFWLICIEVAPSLRRCELVGKIETSVLVLISFSFHPALVLNSILAPHHVFLGGACDVGVVVPWCQRACVDDGDGLCIEVIQEDLHLVVHIGPNRGNAGEEQQR